jgi:hypothetical protein
MIFALLLLGVFPMAVLPLLGEADSEDDTGPGARADEDMSAGDDSGATTAGDDFFDALKSDESVLSPDTADYLAPPGELAEMPGPEGSDPGRDIFIEAGRGDAELADFIAGEDHLTLALADGGTGELSIGLSEDGTSAELSYQPLEGEGFTLRFAGLETVPLGDIDLVLSDPVSGESSSAALVDLLLPADEPGEVAESGNGGGGADTGNGAGDVAGDVIGTIGGGDGNSSDDGDDGGDPVPDVLLPVIEPDLTGGGSDPGDVALAPVIAPDDPGADGGEVALTPEYPDTVDAPMTGGSKDDDLDIDAGDTATGGAGQDTFWLYYDTDADVGYARITDFTPGEDMLRMTLSPGPEGYSVEVIATPDGPDARVLVNGEMVALLQDAPGASTADIFVDTGDSS